MALLSRRLLTQTLPARNKYVYTQMSKRLPISLLGKGPRSRKNKALCVLFSPIWLLGIIIPVFIENRYARFINHIVTNRDLVTLVAFDGTEFKSLAQRHRDGAISWVFWYFKVGEVELLQDGTVDGTADECTFIQNWKEG